MKQVLGRARALAASLALRIGKSFRRRGALDRAATAFKIALRIDPDRPGAWNQYGHILKALSALDDAVAAYRRAVALAPMTAEFHLQLGIALERRGDLHYARNALDRAADLQDGQPDPLKDLAETRRRVSAALLRGDAAFAPRKFTFPFEEPDLV